MTQPAIDLTRHAFVRTIGDVSIYGTWLYNKEQEDTEPALVLIPAFRVSGFKPVAIALSAAFKYNSPRYLANASRQFVQLLGFEDSLSKVHSIASLIYDHLGDLIMMPPDPTRQIIVGEATINLGNGRRHTAQLLDNEQER